MLPAKIYTLLIAAMLGLSSTHAQTPEKALENLRQNFTTESIYIHFDNDVYIAGETIWFKAYLFAGLQPSLYSTAINIDLLNDSGRVISNKILPVIGSSAVGEFELSVDAPQMSYTVRAYTKRMMNFGSEYFYERRLQVLNPVNVRQGNDPAITPVISFLPEGGNMVGGLPLVVAFKASNQFGDPLDIEGEITDSKSIQVVSFKSVHDGMGKFIFLPEADERYTAQYIINNQKGEVALPPVKVSGVTLLIQDLNDKKNFIINRGKLASEAMTPAYLLGIQNNTSMFRIDLPGRNSLVKGEIPVKELASGILQLTLFTKEGLPLAERMLFINNNDFVAGGKLIVDTLARQPHKKNVFTFSVEDTIQGTYSAAITDLNKEIASSSSENMISRMMMQNDVKGYIHNPLYYFSGHDELRKTNLDLVMLTNGWRRFNWDQVINNRLPAMTFKDDNYISFSGKAYKYNSNLIVPNTMLYAFISTKDSSSDILMLDVDSTGSFYMPGMIFNDTATVAFRQISQKDKNVSVGASVESLRKKFSYVPLTFNKVIPSILKNDPLTLKATKRFQYLKEENERFVTLQNVKLSAAKRVTNTALVQSRYETGLFTTSATHLYDFVTNPLKGNPYLNVFDYLRNEAVGVRVNGFQVLIRNTRSFSGPIYATLFLDGIEAQPEFISTIPFAEIALVKVYSNGFVGAVGGGTGGAIAIFTKKGDDRNSISGSTLNRIKLEGFSPVKEFYSPDYSTTVAGARVDKRRTLYWNPYINTSSTNRDIQLSLFNSDDPGPMKLILTGFTAEGKLLHFEKIIE